MIKFKVNTKTFQELLGMFMSKGRITNVAPEDKQMKMAVFIVQDDKVIILGKNTTSTIYTRMTVPAVVENGGTMNVPNMIVFEDTINEISGKEITIEFDTTTKISDGRRKFEVGNESKAISDRTKNFNNLVEWNNCNKLTTEKIVKYQYEKDTYSYDKLFTVKDPGELKSAINVCIKKIKSDTFTLKTTTNVQIETENKQMQQSFADTVDAEVHREATLVMSYIFPVINSIRGETLFLYHIFSDGVPSLWIVNGVIEWMIKYPHKRKEAVETDKYAVYSVEEQGEPQED